MCKDLNDKRERAGKDRAMCLSEMLSEGKSGQGCVHKSLLHSKNNGKQFEVISKDEVRGAGSCMLSEVPQATVQRTYQREDRAAPGRPAGRLKYLSRAERVVAWP